MNDAFLEKLILDIGNGFWNNYSSMFNNDFNLFLELLDHNDVLEHNYPFNEELDGYKNEILLFFLTKDKDKWTKIIGEDIFDLKYIDGKFFEVFYDRNTICDFFKNEKFAEQILSGDYDFFYDYSPDNPVEEMMNELTNENKKIFYNYLFELLNNKTIDAIPDDFDDDDGVFTITSENFPQVFSDMHSLEIIIEEELPNVYELIGNVIRWSYDSAYFDNVYNAFWDALKPYYSNHSFDEKDRLTLEINDFYGEIMRYFKSTNAAIDYYEGDYFSFIKDQHYLLTIDVDGYVDIEDSLNEHFIQNFT